MLGWEELERLCQRCRRCSLYKYKLVFGTGNKEADLMFIGEGGWYGRRMRLESPL